LYHRTSAPSKIGAVDSIVPTLRTKCEEWGTHFIAAFGEIKAWVAY